MIIMIKYREQLRPPKTDEGGFGSPSMTSTGMPELPLPLPANNFFPYHLCIHQSEKYMFKNQRNIFG